MTARSLRRATACLTALALTVLLAACSDTPAPSGGRPASAAPTVAPSPAGVPGVPEPGQVGYLGDPGQLRVVDGTGPAPSGTVWRGGVLHVVGTDVSLDGVFVKGGIDKATTGTLTIRSSIIEGTPASWSPLMVRAGRLDIADSTVRWLAGAPPPGPRWGNGAITGDAAMTVRRCDLSGAPDGIDVGRGDSVIEQNWIHDLALLGTPPDNTHNDGVQSYGGPNLVIKQNRIDIRDKQGRAYDGIHQNGAIFVQPGARYPSQALQVVDNVLVGGGYTLRLEQPTEGAVVTGNRFGSADGAFGSVLVDPSGVSISTWSDNINAHGAQMVSPTGKG